MQLAAFGIGANLFLGASVALIVDAAIQRHVAFAIDVATSGPPSLITAKGDPSESNKSG
jgi:hypothetical protein